MKKNGSWVVLQGDPLPQRAEVVAEVERVGGRLDAGQHARARWLARAGVCWDMAVIVPAASPHPGTGWWPTRV